MYVATGFCHSWRARIGKADQQVARQEWRIDRYGRDLPGSTVTRPEHGRMNTCQRTGLGCQAVGLERQSETGIGHAPPRVEGQCAAGLLFYNIDNVLKHRLATKVCEPFRRAKAARCAASYDQTRCLDLRLRQITI